MCMYVWLSHIAEYNQPRKVTNPARGQLNREDVFFLVPRSRLRIWSRETSSVVPSCVSLLFLHAEAGRNAVEPVSRGQILRRERDWQPYPVDPYSCYMCDHTYIHTHTRQVSHVKNASCALHPVNWTSTLTLAGPWQRSLTTDVHTYTASGQNFTIHHLLRQRQRQIEEEGRANGATRGWLSKHVLPRVFRCFKHERLYSVRCVVRLLFSAGETQDLYKAVLSPCSFTSPPSPLPLAWWQSSGRSSPKEAAFVHGHLCRVSIPSQEFGQLQIISVRDETGRGVI